MLVLASMLIYPSNHEKILKLKGLAKLVKVAKGCDKDEKLLAIGKVSFRAQLID